MTTKGEDASVGQALSPAKAATSAKSALSTHQVIAALKTVYDPEMPVNIYELGLIYGLTVGTDGNVEVRMTLTAPNCPVAESLPAEVERAVRAVPGVSTVKLELTFDPPWSKERMSEAAKLALGIEDIIPLGKLGAGRRR